MEYERNPETAALERLARAVAEVADPALEFDGPQRQRLGVILAMLRQTVEQHSEQSVPSFDDYRSARAHAWATGSVSATFNATTYTKVVDSHGIRECDDNGPDGTCAQCRLQYRRHYGPSRGTPHNQITGTVTGSVVQAGDLGSVNL